MAGMSDMLSAIGGIGGTIGGMFMQSQGASDARDSQNQALMMQQRNNTANQSMMTPYYGLGNTAVPYLSSYITGQPMSANDTRYTMLTPAEVRSINLQAAKEWGLTDPGVAATVYDMGLKFGPYREDLNYFRGPDGQIVSEANVPKIQVSAPQYPDYQKTVAEPMSNWQYQTSPGGQAKLQLGQRALADQLSARGMNYGGLGALKQAELGQNLLGSDYNTERAWKYGNLNDAYKAGLGKYDTYQNNLLNAAKIGQGAAGAAMTSNNNINSALGNWGSNLASIDLQQGNSIAQNLVGIGVMGGKAIGGAMDMGSGAGWFGGMGGGGGSSATSSLGSGGGVGGVYGGNYSLLRG